MKKVKVLMMVIFTALILCTFLIGCSDDPEPTPPPADSGPAIPVPARGKVLILQAYGSASDAAGVSHSFVELYNIDNSPVSLDGVGLYYADGTTVANGTNTATEDGPWSRISLDGKTIPARSSFLILGSKQSSVARHQITENSGDINAPDFTLSNRAFKVALIQSTAAQITQNPYNNGNPISGYIDMVGAANEYGTQDLIFGFEGLPARNSKSEAVRRYILTDTDNNRGISSTYPNATGDFDSIRYASDGITDEELEVYRPKNLAFGAWNPITPPEEVPNKTVAGNASDYADGDLFILQVYGTGTFTDGAVSHSFIELYNNTDNPIDLSDFSLQYANGAGTNWNVINLTDEIPAKSSYLVLGTKKNASGRLQLDEDEADQNEEFYLSNNNFKVALMENQKKLTVVNPFAMTGGKAKDYVDMVGVKSDNSDNIDGYETALAQVISKQASARRGSSTDSDNNSTDFKRVDYRYDDLDRYKPRSSSEGTWDPFETPTTTEALMILQVFGMHANNDSAPTHSFIELYNNTSSPINLSTFSVHWANGNSTNANAPAEKDVWHKIDLTGSIPANSSYLILGPQVVDAAKIADNTTDGRLDLTTRTADVTSAEFLMSNRSYKVALMSNQDNLAVANPWGDANCIDLVSGINTSGTDSVTAAKGPVDLAAVNAATGGTKTISKQKAFRRANLTVTGVTLTDFVSISYNTVDVEKFRPRDSSEGSWTPQFN